MRRMIHIFIIFTFIACVFTGCYGARELDDWAYVYTLGLDKGTSDKLRFTIQVPTLKQEKSGDTSQGSSNSSKSPSYTSMSIDCPTLFAGVEMMNTSLSKTINFTHAGFIIISEELSKEGLAPFINSMIRNRQIRRAMHIIIVKGSASDFVNKFDPILGTAILKVQQNMMDQQNKIGLFDEVSYNDFMNDMKSTYRQPTASIVALNDFSNANDTQSETSKSAIDYYAGELPRNGGNKFEFLGTALFDGDKMVGELNGEETLALLMLKNEFQSAYITINDPLQPKMNITLEVNKQKSSDVNIKFHNGVPIVHAKVYLEGSLQNLQSNIEYENEKYKPLLEKKFEEYIKDDMDKTIKKCKNLNIDSFGFGGIAAMHFLTIQDWEKYNWLGKFKSVNITTEVRFILRRTGTMTKTSPTETSGRR